MQLWISLHELMVTCGCTVLDSDSPCLAAQGWDSIDPTLLRTQPEKVAHVFGIGSELRVLLLELELPQLFSSPWYGSGSSSGPTSWCCSLGSQLQLKKVLTVVLTDRCGLHGP